MNPSAKTAVKPVEPFTIGQQAEQGAETAPAPSSPGAPPAGTTPEPGGTPGMPPELLQANQERDGLQAELDSTKQDQAAENQRVQVETAIRPVQRQTETQLGRVTKIRERLTGRDAKPRASIFKLASELLEKSAAPTNPYTPKDFKKAPLEPLKPSSTGAQASGIPYPLQRTQATPITPPTETYYATPQQRSVGYPESIAPGTTQLPPSVSTQANATDPWNYAGQSDPMVRDIQYGKARSQAVQDLQEPAPAWYNVPGHFNNLMDDITGYDDHMKEMAMPLDPSNPNALAEAQAYLDEQPQSHSERMEQTLGNLFGEGVYSPMADMRERRRAQAEAELRQAKIDAGLDPDERTLADIKNSLDHMGSAPGSWLIDKFLQGGQRGVEHLFSGSAAMEDIGEQYNANGLAGIKTDTLKDYGRNRMGLLSSVPFLGGFGDTDREQTANQVAEANAEAQSEQDVESGVAEARPVPEGGSPNFEGLINALMPFLTTTNQIGGWDGYGSQPDLSSSFIDLARVLGNQQRS